MFSKCDFLYYYIILLLLHKNVRNILFDLEFSVSYMRKEIKKILGKSQYMNNV